MGAAVLNHGLRWGSADVMARLSQGEQVSPEDYYFRTAAQFEAPLGSRYQWLNKAMFVATAERNAESAIVHLYCVL